MKCHVKAVASGFIPYLRPGLKTGHGVRTNLPSLIGFQRTNPVPKFHYFPMQQILSEVSSHEVS